MILFSVLLKFTLFQLLVFGKREHIGQKQAAKSIVGQHKLQNITVITQQLYNYSAVIFAQFITFSLSWCSHETGI